MSVVTVLAVGTGAAGSARQFGDGALAAAQARYGRVLNARRHQAGALERLFAAAGVDYPAPLLIRAYKEEGDFELWGLAATGSRYVRIAKWPFNGYSGDLGPKRRRWDRQIPEGFYRVRTFNGASRYHLSLEIDYPNASDRASSTARHLGNNIFIHGRDVSIGCIPLGDRVIEQVYIAVLDSRCSGFEVPVHIAPCRFGSPGCERRLREFARRKPRLDAFWTNLRRGFELFDATGVPPLVSVGENGRYQFAPPESSHDASSAQSGSAQSESSHLESATSAGGGR